MGFIYTPKTNPKPPKITIADLIPIGRENAIKREDLTILCVKHELINKHSDRMMRSLIEKARIDYTILNLSDGNGYYRLSHEDTLDLQRYIRQEENRGKSTFRNIGLAKKLYADYLAGRK